MSGDRDHVSTGMPGDPPACRLPVPSEVFERRAARFRELASGHSLEQYLIVLAQVAEGQARASRVIQPIVEGEPALAEAVRLRPAPADLQERAQPRPLFAREWPRSSAWRRALEIIIDAMEPLTLPELTTSALVSLGVSSPTQLERAADIVLAGDCARADLAAAPFVGAALQVYWTTLAARLPALELEDQRHLSPSSAPGCGGPHASECPACGRPAAAGIVTGDQHLRYLSCGLCSTEWYLPRLICSACGSSADLSYFEVEDGGGACRAETCPRCGTYLKLFYQERAPGAEAIADDVASLALDLLMTDKGYVRTGSNLLLLTCGSA
jgi:FdhE protein